MLNIPNRPCFRISVANNKVFVKFPVQKQFVFCLPCETTFCSCSQNKEVVNRMKLEWLFLTPACFSLWAKLLFVWRCQRAGNIVSVPPFAVSEPLCLCELTLPCPRTAEEDQAYPWRPRWGHVQRCPISGDKMILNNMYYVSLHNLIIWHIWLVLPYKSRVSKRYFF